MTLAFMALAFTPSYGVPARAAERGVAVFEFGLVDASLQGAIQGQAIRSRSALPGWARSRADASRRPGGSRSSIWHRLPAIPPTCEEAAAAMRG